MSRILLALATAQLLAAGAAQMAAQESHYDSSALRLEGVFFGPEVYRGTGDNLVGRPGVFHGLDVASLVNNSPNALAEARRFQGTYTRGIILTGIGILGLGVGHGLGTIHDFSSLISRTVTYGGLVSLLYGTKLLTTSYSALSKSLWWYNRDLAAGG